MMDDSDSSISSEGCDAVDVTVQLSRFHLETIEGSATGDVDIRGLCLSVGDRELLSDAHLSLRRGTRYGLIGRNGTGKSTLLRSLAKRAIPGLPRDMKVLYVQQDLVPGDRRSALQTVMDSGSPRGALAARIAELEAALEAGGEEEEQGEEEEEEEEEGEEQEGCEGPARQLQDRSQRLVAVVRSLMADRAEQAAEEAEQTASRRSRARGKEALRSAVAAREQARRTQAVQLTPDQAASLAPQLLADMYDRLDELGAGSEEEERAAAAAALRGLGFSEEQAAVPTRQLSGGWRMRVALACALMARPHLLLLDEPTNHLDLQSILWTQDYLTTRCPGQTVVVVSHDRSFLNAVAGETIVLRDGRLEYFPGPYDAYVQARAEASLHKERQVAGQERQRAHLADTIARAERAAREAGDDKRLLQAASRRKKMDRLGAEKTADGKKFKVSYWAGWHETLRPQVELDRPEEPVALQLPPPEPLRQRGPLVQLRDVAVAYTTTTTIGSTAVSTGTGTTSTSGVTDSANNSGVTSASGRSGGHAVAKEAVSLPAGPGASDRYHDAAAGGRGQARPGTRKGPEGPRGMRGTGGKAAASVSGSGIGAAGVAAAMAAAGGVAGGAGGGSSSGGGGGGPGGGVVLSGVTMDIEQGARIGLLGLNGSGKSSLLRVLAGALQPAAGEVTSPCPRLLVALLDQHGGRRLLGLGLGLQSGRPQGSGDQGQGQGQQQTAGGAGNGASGSRSGSGREGPATAFSLVQTRAPHLRPQEVFDYLGKFAVPGPLASTPLAALSGGQRCRVALALEMLPRPHLLLLDEPTNHLDLATVTALAAAVRAWEGAAVIASHDLAFLKDTCHEVWVVEGGRVVRQPQAEVAEAVEAYAARLQERLRRRAEKMGRRQQ